MRKNLKIIVLGAIFVLLINTSMAQQDPMFTYYLQNPIAFNPAIAGTTSGLNLSLLSRHQWVGMDGAPASYSFGAHTPYIKQNMGLGLNVMTDKAGPLRITHLTASYAYQIKVIEGLMLSMGLKGGASFYNAAIGNIRVNDPSDPNFQGNENRVSPNLGVGFYLYSKLYYAGFSIPRLIEPRMNKEYRESGEPYNPQMYLMGGYNFTLNREWEILPSMLIGIMGGSPVSTDITAQFAYMKVIHFGTHYRLGDAMGLFISGKVYDELSIGYAFDFTLNKLSRANSGTHEIVITYKLDDLWNTASQLWRF